MALMGIAFPNTSSDPISPEEFAISRAINRAAPVSNQVDTVEELKRYKALLDQGILTEEEFAAKKRQLLGL